MAYPAPFLQTFMREVCKSLNNDFQDNYDEGRFGPETENYSGSKWSVKSHAKAYLRQRGYSDVSPLVESVVNAVDFVSSYLARFERLYLQLDDDTSRELLVKLMAFRVLGYRRVKLPTNNEKFWSGLERVNNLANRSDFLQLDSLGWRLFKFDLDPLGVPVVLYTTDKGAYAQFFSEQYRCACADRIIEASAGDYVIDAGGCWGDSALYFASKVGASGRIFTYEFMPSNLLVLKTNFDLNPVISSRVSVVARAAWDRSGIALQFQENGPGTCVREGVIGEADKSVVTLSIDDLVEAKRLSRVDFIKMDIEGAELVALRGAERTIRRFKPKLAIAVYHRVEDFFDIPDFLRSLQVGYRLFLRHFTIHAEETILFACPT